MPTNLAIVGIGRWGRVLVDATQGHSDTVRFTRGATRTPAKAADYCAAHGITIAQSFEELLADPSVDGVVLATPHSQHGDQIRAAAEAGKHVFCEKPVTLERADAERAMAAVEKAGVVFAPGHNRRFLPAIQHLKAMVEGGELGTLLHIEGNMSGHVGSRYTADMWRIDPGESPAGGLAGSGIHVIDTMIHLAGPVSSVLAQSDRLVHAIPFDDTTTFLMRFSAGPTGYVAAMTATASIFRIQVFGSKGWAELRGETVLDHQPVDGTRVTRTFPAVSTERLQLEAFGAAIRGEAPYPIAHGDVVAGVAAFEAVPVSAKEKRWVDL